MRAIAFLALLPLAACSVGSAGVPGQGSGSSRTYAVSDFTGVDLAGFDNVDVTIGNSFAVRAEGPSGELDKLVIEKKGDVLSIGRRHVIGINWGGKGVTVHVTMPAIATASIAGSGDLKVDRVEGNSFKGLTAGSGDMTLGNMKVGNADLSIAGSGNIAAAGTANALSLSIAGSGNIDTAKVAAQSAKVSIAGSGDISADVNGPAKVSLVGSGNASMGAHARCTNEKIGSGTIRCGS